MTHAEFRERKQKIIEDYQNQLSKPQLADKYGVSLVTVQQMLAGASRQEPKMNGEEWKQIGESRYKVSNMGRIWNSKYGKLVKTSTIHGMLNVTLKDEGFLLHSNVASIVFKHFIKDHSTSRIKFRDDNPFNCMASNLIEAKSVPKPIKIKVKKEVKEQRESQMDSIILGTETSIPYRDNCTVGIKSYGNYYLRQYPFNN